MLCGLQIKRPQLSPHDENARIQIPRRRLYSQAGNGCASERAVHASGQVYAANLVLNINSYEVSPMMSTDIKDSFEFHARRLCGALHVQRFRILYIEVYAKKQ